MARSKVDAQPKAAQLLGPLDSIHKAIAEAGGDDAAVRDLMDRWGGEGESLKAATARLAFEHGKDLEAALDGVDEVTPEVLAEISSDLLPLVGALSRLSNAELSSFTGEQAQGAGLDRVLILHREAAAGKLRPDNLGSVERTALEAFSLYWSGSSSEPVPAGDSTTGFWRTALSRLRADAQDPDASNHAKARELLTAIKDVGLVVLGGVADEPTVAPALRQFGQLSSGSKLDYLRPMAEACQVAPECVEGRGEMPDHVGDLMAPDSPLGRTLAAVGADLGKDGYTVSWRDLMDSDHRLGTEVQLAIATPEDKPDVTWSFFFDFEGELAGRTMSIDGEVRGVLPVVGSDDLVYGDFGSATEQADPAAVQAWKHDPSDELALLVHLTRIVALGTEASKALLGRIGSGTWVLTDMPGVRREAAATGARETRFQVRWRHGDQPRIFAQFREQGGAYLLTALQHDLLD